MCQHPQTPPAVEKVDPVLLVITVRLAQKSLLAVPMALTEMLSLESLNLTARLVFLVIIVVLKVCPMLLDLVTQVSTV